MENNKLLYIVCPDLSGKGGTETVLKSFLEYSSNISGYDLQLVLPYASHDKSWLKNLKYIGVKNRSSFSFFNKIKGLLFIIKFLTTHKNNIYICLSSQLIFISSLFRFFSRRNFTIISWIHFSLFHEKTVNVNFLKKADFHFAISSGIKKQMETIGIVSDKIFVIYNPIRPNEILSIGKKSNKKVHFAYLGRIMLEGQKNIKELIEAISYVTGDWRLSIIGEGDDLDKCKIKVKEANLENNVHFFGWLSEPWTEINSIDVVVLTSKFEGFPMVLLEAMSRGVPCISSNCATGPEDIIVNNINGYLYECGEVERLTVLMQNIVDGKNVIEGEIVRESISKFYIDKYTKNFYQCVDKIIAMVN